MIKVITDRDSLLEIRDIWDNLYDKDIEATPFQKFDYVISVLDLSLRGDDKLHIILVKNDPTNEWVAIFPFVLDNQKTLRFINTAHTDFCAPLIHPDYNHYKLYKELSQAVIDDNSINGICLENLVQSSPLLSVLKPHFKYMIANDCNFYSSIPITQQASDSDSIDAFRYVQAKHRTRLRKTKKTAVSKGARLEILNKNDGKPYPKNEVETLIKVMETAGIRTEAYFSEAMLKFWQKLYESEVLSLALLYEGETVMSCNFMFYDERRREYIKWIMLYRENNWNMILNILLVDHIYTQGGGSINFARGIYDYKLSNFHPDVKPLFCVKIAKTRWGHFKNIVSTAFHYSKPIIKSFIRK